MDRQSIIFVAIVAGVITLAYLAVSVLKLSPAQIIAAVIIVIILAAFFPRIEEFKEYERGVVFRFGKYHRTAGPGWETIFSTIESFVRVDLRTQVYDIPPQKVITKEDIKLDIDATAYVRIVNPRKAVTEIKDIRMAMTQMLHAEMRNQIANMLLQDVLEKTEDINARLKKTIEQVENDWGIKAMNVEITHVEVPKGLLDAIQKREEAHEYKRKVETEAQAKQAAINILDQATSNMSDKTLAYLYMDTLKKMADGKSNKIIFPLELSRLAGILTGEMKEKGQKPNYDEIVEGLLAAYKGQRKDLLDKPPQKKK